MSRMPTAEERLAQLNERLDAAGTSPAGEGALQGFDREVAELCRQLLALPEDGGKKYAGDLEALYQRLDRLQTIPVPADAASPRIGTRQASQAYRQAGHVTPPGTGSKD